jgi:hypothetical protein
MSIGRRKFETDFKTAIAYTFTTPHLAVNPAHVTIDSIAAGSMVVKFSVIVPVSGL